MIIALTLKAAVDKFLGIFSYLVNTTNSKSKYCFYSFNLKVAFMLCL